MPFGRRMIAYAALLAFRIKIGNKRIQNSGSYLFTTQCLAGHLNGSIVERIPAINLVNKSIDTTKTNSNHKITYSVSRQVDLIQLKIFWKQKKFLVI